MLSKINIQNFKSIQNDTIELGVVNVFIGENGCGKTNILEALGFVACWADGRKIDNEALSLKGIRAAKPEMMRSGFAESEKKKIY